jgi:hypothetical protein
MNSRSLAILSVALVTFVLTSDPIHVSSQTPIPATAASTTPEYIVVMGREDKHTIIRYDINSPIFKQPYTHVKNPDGTSGTWSLNFKDFLRLDDLPEACKTLYQKKRFFSNIATDIQGDCQHWEFNQGHIYKLREDSYKNIEEVYTYNLKKNSKKFCLRFTSFEKGKEGAYE